MYVLYWLYCSLCYQTQFLHFQLSIIHRVYIHTSRKPHTAFIRAQKYESTVLYMDKAIPQLSH